MKLNKTKNDETTYIAGLTLSSNIDGVSFAYRPWDNRKIGYSITVEPKEYLSIAKKSLSELSKIAGVEYGVFVRVDKHSNWSKL